MLLLLFLLLFFLYSVASSSSSSFARMRQGALIWAEPFFLIFEFCWVKTLHFDPIKKKKKKRKKAQIRALYSASATRLWFVEGEGRRRSVPFWGFVPGRRRALYAPKPHLLQQASPRVRQGADVSHHTALRLGAPETHFSQLWPSEW